MYLQITLLGFVCESYFRILLFVDCTRPHYLSPFPTLLGLGCGPLNCMTVCILGRSSAELELSSAVARHDKDERSLTNHGGSGLRHPMT